MNSAGFNDLIVGGRFEYIVDELGRRPKVEQSEGPQVLDDVVQNEVFHQHSVRKVLEHEGVLSIGCGLE